MRCMMAVMLMLGSASLNLVQGQNPAKGAQDAVLNRSEDLLRQQFLEDPERFVMRTAPAPHPAPGGMVSVNQLKIPDKAAKELQRSDKALRAGDVRGSTGHMEKALAIYPNMPVGHKELGTRYAALKEYDKAVGEFEKALALKPDYRPAVDSIAAVLCLQHRYAEAEPVARRALEMEPQAAASQYLLGATLVQEGKYSDEAAELLEKTKTKYPRARLFLAIVEEQRGETGLAADELREYLRGGWQDYRAMAQDWLEKLEKQNQAEKKTNEEEFVE